MRLYRQLTPSELNSRNLLTIIYAGSLLTFLLAALSLKAIKPVEWQSLLSGRSTIQILEDQDITLTGVAPKIFDCAKNCSYGGIPIIPEQGTVISSPSALNDPSIARTVIPTSSQKRHWAKLTYNISGNTFKRFGDNQEHLVVGIHRISYRLAQISINGISWGSFSNSSPIRISIPQGLYESSGVKIELVYSVNENGFTFLERNDLIPPFISSSSELPRITKFELSFQENTGAIIGLMSRILIGVFALMLFLFMDSAPESLGLAFLLGSEALALGLLQGWVTTPIDPFLIHFCSQMGDVFRLYFFLQLSRVTKPRTAQWLLWGTLISIPWGIAKQMEIRWGIDGLAIIPRFRDLFVGLLGSVACLYTLWSIRSMHLPWRRMALILGALAGIQQMIGPLLHYWPQAYESDLFRGFYIVYEAMSVYILALSTFTNISTLENRVKNLSAAKAKSDVIEQELELGRTVQKAFLSLPKLPKDFNVVSSHEAAVYVSGDIHFVHWSEVEERLTLLLVDVTGHGVQASLKATACYMIASNLWRNREDSSHPLRSTPRTTTSKLETFHRQASELLSLMSETPEIASFGGIEFFPRSRRAYIYRNNFHTPLILTKGEEGSWVFENPSVQIGKVIEVVLKPGSLVALYSDGFAAGSRQIAGLRRFISERLQNFDGSSEVLKQYFHDFNQQNTKRPDDDRTLIVLSWKQEAMSVKKAS